MLHTFYFSLTPNSSHFVSMCAGGDIIDKTISEASQILQRISNGQNATRLTKILSGGAKRQKQAQGAC
jgi:hypothetical protein